jgi:glutamate:GABA antiporter
MKRSINTIMLALMIPAAIFGLDSLILPVEYGLASIFFYLIAAICFFLPTAVVVWRLNNRWPGERGGIYLWVSKAFSPKWGLWAVWLQWTQQVVWYPTVLSYMASTFARALFPHWAAAPWFVAIFCIAIFSVLTWLASLGIGLSARFIACLFALGVVLPGIVLIVAAFACQFSGAVTYLHFSWQGLLPSLHDLKNIALFNGVVTGFTGIELCSAYAYVVKKPSKSFPVAILFTTVITTALFVLGTLAIVMMLSPHKMVLTAAVIDALSRAMSLLHLSFLTPVLAFFIVIGGVAIVLVWILGPMLSFHASAKAHQLPAFFSKTNNRGIPVRLLVIQAIVVGIFSLTFFFSSSVSSGFWLLNALSGQLYFLMYILMFLAAFHFFRHNKGVRLLIGLGMLSSFLGIITPFFPPDAILKGSSIADYEGYLCLGLLVICVLPWLYLRVRAYFSVSANALPSE